LYILQGRFKIAIFFQGCTTPVAAWGAMSSYMGSGAVLFHLDYKMWQKIQVVVGSVAHTAPPKRSIWACESKFQSQVPF